MIIHYTDGRSEKVPYSFKTAQNHLGFVEPVTLKNGKKILVDEDGNSKKLPVNPWGTQQMRDMESFTTIVGTVIELEDGEDID